MEIGRRGLVGEVGGVDLYITWLEGLLVRRG